MYQVTVVFLQELDYQEFKMFAMACIDRQTEIEQKRMRHKRKKGEGQGQGEEERGWCVVQ